VRILRKPLLFAFAALWVAGCGGGGPGVEMISVSGTVKFKDGTVPQGERAEVNFEPVAGGPQQLRKVAYGEIQPDGSFEMTTVKPGDGVIAGKYKVIFVVHRTYIGQESVVPERYTKPETTPFEITVEAGMEPPAYVLERQ
jgi:hypothetical protein